MSKRQRQLTIFGAPSPTAQQQTSGLYTELIARLSLMLSHIEMPVKILSGRKTPYDGDRRFVRPLKTSAMRKPRRKESKKARRASGAAAAAADDDDAEVPHKSICLVCLGNELVEQGICITAGNPTEDWLNGDKDALTIIAMKAVQKSVLARRAAAADDTSSMEVTDEEVEEGNETDADMAATFTAIDKATTVNVFKSREEAARGAASAAAPPSKRGKKRTK